jgi:two-component system chemotaxis sensor kinase CheA
VTVSDDRFAIPQVNLRELIRVTAAQHSERIGVVGDAKVLLLRGEMIPIVDFSALLNGTPAMSDLQKDLCMAVVSTGTLQYALIVDGFINTEEIVVKALGRHLKGLHEYAGATIMGDGKVALILDAGGLATKAGLTAVAASAETHATAQLSTAATKITAGQLTSLFLFQNGPSETCAVPLNMIRRVERIQASQVEMIGGRRTMQYRGGSLPLVTLKDAIAVNQISDSQELVVIVFTLGEREVGLLAAMPVDVVETTVAIDNTTLQQRGVSGSAIIHDKTVLMINLPELVGVVYPDWAPHVQAELVKHDAKKLPVILLAEDSDFFRTQERRIIEAEGYKVIDAPDGEAAWELLQSNADLVRMVITDVEMPRLTGLQLVERMRAEPRFAHIPVIALSSLAGEEDIQRGKSAGMTEYQVKLDPEKLLEGMRHFLNG